MSPVYTTAPELMLSTGVLTGKVVEIDHGNGIATRYGHRHRHTVSVGQTVEARTQIGLLGSTGHASGPHMHYEVIISGQTAGSREVDRARPPRPDRGKVALVRAPCDGQTLNALSR